jgi:adenylate cyclase
VTRIRTSLLALGLLLSALAVLLYLREPDFLRFLDHKSYDTFLRASASTTSSGQVTIVDIDDESLAAYGQWPWPRDMLAALLDGILAARPAAVGLDIVFPEPERRSSSRPGVSDGDALLAETLSKGPVVLGCKFLFDSSISPTSNVLPRHAISPAMVSLKKGPWVDAPLFVARGAVCSIPSLSEAASGVGFVNALPDTDGIIRRTPLLIRYDDRYYPSLALGVVLRGGEDGQVMIAMSSAGTESIRADARRIPVDGKGNMLVHYRSLGGHITRVSAEDILKKRVPEQDLRGKLVFVGTTCVGLERRQATPLSPSIPGIEIHATIADNILTGDFINRPAHADGLELLALIVAGVLSSLLLASAGSGLSALLLVAGITVVLGGSQLALARGGLFVSPVMPALLIVANFSGLTLLKFWLEERSSRRQAQLLVATQDVTIRSLAALTESRDTETGLHIDRTSHYVRALAEQLRRHPRYRNVLSTETIDELFRVAPLHDIGKVGVRDSVLQKPGPLTDEEFEEIKQHTIYGRQAMEAAEERLGHNSFLRRALEIAYSHHERWDGSGYPEGLAGEDIPLSARLMALADAYDALTSRRPYKSPYSHEKAAAILREGRGTHFAPDVVDAFIAVEDEFTRIATTFADPVPRTDTATKDDSP